MLSSLILNQPEQPISFLRMELENVKVHGLKKLMENIYQVKVESLEGDENDHIQMKTVETSVQT